MKKIVYLNSILLVLLIGFNIYQFVKNSDDKKIHKEFNVERLNVVGSDGKKYVVISNPKRQALPEIDGHLIDTSMKERNSPGLLFFNSLGDEVGGLLFESDTTNSYQVLTFDQFKNDQIMTLRKEEYKENGKWKRSYGLLLQDRSDKPITKLIKEMTDIQKIKDSAERTKKMNEFSNSADNQSPRRLFIGKQISEKVGLFLYDKNNNPRMAIYIDSLGNPVIKTIDANGKVKFIN